VPLLTNRVGALKVRFILLFFFLGRGAVVPSPPGYATDHRVYNGFNCHWSRRN